MKKVIISVLLSLATIPLFFLVLPLFVFPPLAFYLGLKAALGKGQPASGSGLIRAAGFLAAFFAAAVFFYLLHVLNTEYRA